MNRLLSALVGAALLALPGGALAAPKLVRVDATGVGASPSYGMARTANGTLHLVFQTSPGGTSAPDGLGSRSISPAGVLGSPVQALSGYSPGKPGLALLPDGTLNAVFGGSSPDNQTGVYGISSSDGGATWSAPGVVGAGGPMEALAYGSDITAQVTGGGVPVLTLPQAGGVIIQQGFGQGASTTEATDASDNSAGGVDSAVDAGSGEVVASWASNAGNGGDFIRTVAPALGNPMPMPGPVRNEVVIAGRDKGPGVFAAYSLDGKSVRLLRYGGGSVAVGKARGITLTKLGTATGLDGRIWVMWGNDSAIALTRSNKAVTRFEPIQLLKPDAAGLDRLAGDGRLGPLDLLVDMIPNGNPIPPAGTFHARVLPELSASAKFKKGQLTVTVTDAGDPVAGATVGAGGKTATTNAGGVAKLKLKKPPSGAKITAPGYQALKLSI